MCEWDELNEKYIKKVISEKDKEIERKDYLLKEQGKELKELYKEIERLNNIIEKLNHIIDIIIYEYSGVLSNLTCTDTSVYYVCDGGIEELGELNDRLLKKWEDMKRLWGVYELRKSDKE